MISQLLQSNLDEIRDLCREHQVSRLDAFGSVLRPDFKEASDIDFLVTFIRGPEINAFRQYFDFKEALEALLGREVDLVCAPALRNPYFKAEVARTAQPLYAA